MRIQLQYGEAGVGCTVAARDVTVLEPQFVEGLGDETAAFGAAVAKPIESRPLGELIGAGDRVAIVIPDITRPFPSDRVLPWLFEALAHVPAANITVINGTGSHRVNTDEELRGMVGEAVLRDYRVVNHNAHDPDQLLPAGHTADGHPVLFNREYVEADRRIVLGFIEPHFFAGFSGGYKAVFPGVADIASIMHYHRAETIGDPRSTWGVLDGNPTQEQVRAGGALLPVDFCVNVTLNRLRQITAFFCGDTLTAHAQGCAYAKSTAMAPCDHPYPIVVTTNGGYPLDQNLYQAVKGMSAAAQIVTEGGLIVTAAECRDGFPAHGNFRKLMLDHDSPQAVLDTVLTPGFSMYDQWEAQKLAMIQTRARVALYSTIESDELRRAHIEPVEDLDAFLADALRQFGGGPVAVLPEGPMTIPYLAG